MSISFLYNLLIALISWIIIYLNEKRNIFAAWIAPPNKRLIEFLKGFSLMASLCIITQVFISKISNTTWVLSDSLSLNKLLSSFFYDINSVLFEELIFRGVLLYLLVKNLNTKKGILISATAFGIYHWFTGGVFGNLPAMTVVFIVTGVMGYVFALAYTKTKSLILPFGLHLGWNLINHNVFSNGPNGTIIFQVNGQLELSNSHQLLSFALYLIVIAMVLLFVKSKYITEQENTIANDRLK